ncbi:MAG: hypothetical protein Kow0062_01780 [Acidobacteriota bacterium]
MQTKFRGDGARPPEAPGERGFTLVELLIAVAIIAVLMAIAIPELLEARTRAEMRSVVSDLRSVHTAFKEYFIDHNEYPDGGSNFNLVNFNPLTKLGYYRGLVTAKMIGGRADGYDAPDDMGTNQEFWLEMTLKRDPTIRFLVADSDDAPLGGGVEYDGVYVFRNGVLEKM